MLKTNFYCQRWIQVWDFTFFGFGVNLENPCMQGKGEGEINPPGREKWTPSHGWKGMLLTTCSTHVFPYLTHLDCVYICLRPCFLWCPEWNGGNSRSLFAFSEWLRLSVLYAGLWTHILWFLVGWRCVPVLTWLHGSISYMVFSPRLLFKSLFTSSLPVKL